MRPFLAFALLALSAPLLAAEAQIAGRVVDAGGAPIRGARVYVSAAQPLHGPSAICPSCYRECGRYVDSGAGGDFRIADLDPALKVRLLAVASGYEPSYSGFNDPDGTVTLTLERRAPADEAHLIRGRVVDPKGKPIVGAEVDPSGVHLDRGVGYGTIPGLELRSITNANGEFELRIPPKAKSLDVRVRAMGYAPVIDRGLVPGVNRTIEVYLGAAIRGRIVHDGKRVKLVQWDRTSGRFLGPEEIGTDEEGRFAIPALGIHETYVVSVAMDAAPLVASEKLMTTAGDLSTTDAGTFDVTTGCRIAGRSAPHTRVTLFRDHTFDARVTESGDDGSFVFDGVPPDNLTLRAGRARRGVTVMADHDVTDVMLPID